MKIINSLFLIFFIYIFFEERAKGKSTERLSYPTFLLFSISFTNYDNKIDEEYNEEIERDNQYSENLRWYCERYPEEEKCRDYFWD
jgi:hypothetical protein